VHAKCAVADHKLACESDRSSPRKEYGARRHVARRNIAVAIALASECADLDQRSIFVAEVSILFSESNSAKPNDEVRLSIANRYFLER
jgi:hypothetical protein